jgi:hypothetical protein
MPARQWCPLLMWLRRLGLGRNPLRRRSDVVESVVLALVLLLVPASVPMGVQTSRIMFERGTRASAEHAARSHQAVAVLQENGTHVSTSTGDSGLSGKLMAKAVWQAPNGDQRSGVLDVGPQDRTGQRIPLWTDDFGNPAVPPETAAELRMQAVVVGLLVAVGWLLVVIAGYTVVRWRLDRRRLAQWELEWAQAHSRWGRHAA